MDSIKTLKGDIFHFFTNDNKDVRDKPGIGSVVCIVVYCPCLSFSCCKTEKKLNIHMYI